MSGDYEIISKFTPVLGPEHFTPEAKERRRLAQERHLAIRKARADLDAEAAASYVPPKSLAEANKRLQAKLTAMTPEARRAAEKQAEGSKG